MNAARYAALSARARFLVRFGAMMRHCDKGTDFYFSRAEVEQSRRDLAAAIARMKGVPHQAALPLADPSA